MKALRRPFAIFVIGFLALFALRMGYEIWEGSTRGQAQQNGIASDEGYGRDWSFSDQVRNYASYKSSKKFEAEFSSQASSSPRPGGEQKYEKIAHVGLKTAAFDTDEKDIRKLIAETASLIQYEQRSGLKGLRVLRLSVGVNPDKFDAFVEKAQTFGKLTELTINKTDKTNEYQQLQAKRVSLEKARDALATLKQREGEIKSMIELEQQILAVENQIQDLGVSLGVFNQENEFVTVKFRIQEAAAIAPLKNNYIKAVFTSFVWTIQYYALLCVAFASLAVALFLAATVLKLAGQWVAALDANNKTR